jgi:hypothetical protein
VHRPGHPPLPAALSAQHDAGLSRLVGSLLGLWRQHRALRRAAIAQGLLSVGFSAFWSTLAIMLHASPFHMGSAASGAFGLAGAAGAWPHRWPVIWRIARGRSWSPCRCRLAAMAFVMLSLAPMLSLNMQLGLLAAGAVLFDLGVQASLIAHQAVIYRIDPAARSRLNAVLFVCMFIGMSLGSVLASVLLAGYGWSAVTACCTGILAGLAGACW